MKCPSNFHPSFSFKRVYDPWRHLYVHKMAGKVFRLRKSLGQKLSKYNTQSLHSFKVWLTNIQDTEKTKHTVTCLCLCFWHSPCSYLCLMEFQDLRAYGIFLLIRPWALVTRSSRFILTVIIECFMPSGLMERN